MVDPVVASGPLTAVLVAYSDDPAEAVARRILEKHRDELPDLSRVVILITHTDAAPRLRRVLLDQAQAAGHQALLGPHITTLSEWIRTHTYSTGRLLNEYVRELLLADALKSHRKLLGDSNPWALADSLLELFDELTAQRVEVPERLAAFRDQLHRAYAAGTPAQARHQPLDREANLVYTLWRAWHQQLGDEQLVDERSDYALRLMADAESPVDNTDFYALGLVELDPAEQHWLRRRLAAGSATLVLHGAVGHDPARYHPSAVNATVLAGLGELAPPPEPPADAYSAFIDNVFDDNGTAFAARVAAFAAEVPDSPLGTRLHMLAADDAEQEAHAVALQVRRWLLADRRSIGIVTQNRRLARRVRALLERAEIPLADAAGWALSTTSAAATLERWLQALEQDFHHLPLLDVLKSPFVFVQHDRHLHMQAVYRLERDIVLRESVGSGLKRYRRHLSYRQHRLDSHWTASGIAALNQLLDSLEHAAAPLQPLLRARKRPAAHYLDALSESMSRLAMDGALAGDAAGERILQALLGMREAAAQHNMRIDWADFRTWLGRTLERHRFRPPIGDSAVQLFSLGESNLARFDAVVLCGCDAEHLPGAAQHSPFFNDAVRGALGLRTSRQRLTLRFYHFRRLLESAAEVLITWQRERDGDPVVPAAWVELLTEAHRLVYQNDLQDHQLAALVKSPQTQLAHSDDTASPAPPMRPAPPAPTDLLPDALSASAYQQLVDCPYQFFAAQCLALSAPEEVRETLEKSDYGERVHRCLQAFHSEVPGLPGPYTEPLTTANRAAAVRCLQDISHAVFAYDLEDNFLHRGWLIRWLALIPAYVDWQIQRATEWQVSAVEQRLEQAAMTVPLTGRLDRVDRSADGLGIIDYKTGYTPRQPEVDAGEAVQLPFYALLLDQPVSRTEYLRLDGGETKTTAVLEGAQLSELKQQHAARLNIVTQALAEGAALPAWGDEQTCQWCVMQGVCRRAGWESEDDAK